MLSTMTRGKETAFSRFPNTKQFFLVYECNHLEKKEKGEEKKGNEKDTKSGEGESRVAQPWGSTIGDCTTDAIRHVTNARVQYVRYVRKEKRARVSSQRQFNRAARRRQPVV